MIVTMANQSTTTQPVHKPIPTPLGTLTLVRREANLVGIYFDPQWYRPNSATFGTPSEDGFEEIVCELSEYFAGERTAFALPYSLEGSEFQQRVWALIEQVPYGETATYGELARQLGEGTDPRDVGAAVGRNPISIVVPCHRIVGAGGKLTGYAGGLDRKRFLLDLEHDHSSPEGRLF